ncbi:MAG: UDP-N-acetylmuramoyl-L-alanyl-D-glutamate--2,6-diaminopimelate ligase [Alphaproteobacteria bacterium]|nr:UDP-N-acetylmuramoyl-L-alanyl-D-glutamate--2,6-diaminopimelate ligase [Alphaproteobacteria bacterium]
MAHPRAAEIAALEITSLGSDSREAGKGFLFVALAGSHADGRDFAAAAIKAGAAAILTDERPFGAALEAVADSGVPVLTCEAPRRELALAAARFWRRQPGMIAAVTGTNGKTSTVEFIRQIWRRATWDAASIGTLGLQGPDPRTMQGRMLGLPPLTTPDAVSLHAALQPICGAGITHLALEASSHGLAQHRLDGLNIHIAGFTNLSRDHLDHHPDMEAYFAAKARLFTELLLPGGCAVINIDDTYGARLAEMMRNMNPQERVILTVGSDRKADFRITDVAAMDFGIDVTVEHDGKSLCIPMALAGTFQAVNAVTAAGVVVDYAHTPDALESALRALRPETRGRLAVVFGAGGDRDAGKRPMMGSTAQANADLVYVTDDNPRSEDAATIRAAIIETCPNAIEIADRGEAIAAAMREMNADDVLLIAGKGHENVQLVGSETLPFSDSSVARNAIRRLTADGGDG